MTEFTRDRNRAVSAEKIALEVDADLVHEVIAAAEYGLEARGRAWPAGWPPSMCRQLAAARELAELLEEAKLAQ